LPVPSSILIGIAQGAPPIQCCSVGEMEAVLDRLHAEELGHKAADQEHIPLQVTIAFTGHEIYTGLGSAESFLMVGAEPYEEWYTAVSDAKAQGLSKMFYGDAQDTYWAPKHLIPMFVVREAIRYFVEHRQLSPSLTWES
jgi:Immunity protein Imm1